MRRFLSVLACCIAGGACASKVAEPASVVFSSTNPDLRMSELDTDTLQTLCIDDAVFLERTYDDLDRAFCGGWVGYLDEAECVSEFESCMHDPEAYRREEGPSACQFISEVRAQCPLTVREIETCIIGEVGELRSAFRDPCVRTTRQPVPSCARIQTFAACSEIVVTFSIPH